jgi:hypothetical protein|uniref:ORF38 n=1 Tax=Nitrosopumilaceae spindle-shaped virus TaxID=3065433 RepID=A0AAT9J7B2_9VIRU
MTKSQARLIRLSSRLISRARNTPTLNVCYTCKNGFKCDEWVVTKKASHYTKWYHEKCARSINLI